MGNFRAGELSRLGTKRRRNFRAINPHPNPNPNTNTNTNPNPNPNVPRAFIVQAQKFPGTKVPHGERSRLGTKTPRRESSGFPRQTPVFKSSAGFVKGVEVQSQETADPHCKPTVKPHRLKSWALVYIYIVCMWYSWKRLVDAILYKPFSINDCRWWWMSKLINRSMILPITCRQKLNYVLIHFNILYRRDIFCWSTPCPEKKRPRYFQLQLSHSLVDFYNFYAVGNRNEHSTITCKLFTLKIFMTS